ncbi:hypothetical protein GF406_04815 [candidate division KSB1 bacterium]|nr:hypothetical protein [candidate division KSB1 bacterium]
MMNQYNTKTKITTSVIGTLLGMSGFINHGIFEILQGNTPTNGRYIEAIGELHRFWVHGTEGAFTLIPNFLITGISVLIVSLAIILWSIKFIQIKRGTTIFLFLLILLTLVGGGIGHIVLFIPTWAYATRINKPLKWWRKIMPTKAKKVLGKMWMPMLIITSLSWLMVMELGIFGFFPGQSNPDTLLNITFGFVLLTVVLANFTYICGFAQDIQEQN